MRERIGLLIPCRNVASTVGALFESFSPDLLKEVEQVLCIDNASTDQTFITLAELQSRKGTAFQSKLNVIKNSENYDYGGSIKIGFRHFIDIGLDWVIILHSDDQGEANAILGNFLSAQKAFPESDVILASRFEKDSDTAGYSRSRLMGNLFFNKITAVTTGVQISDAGTAITMTRTSLLKKMPYFQLTNGLQFHPQLNILIYSDKNARIREIPLAWRDSDLPSNVRVLRYCFQLLRMLICYRVNLFLGRQGVYLFPFHDRNFNPKFELFPPEP